MTDKLVKKILNSYVGCFSLTPSPSLWCITRAAYPKTQLQCSPYQTVTGTIYRLKQHFLSPATAWRFAKIKEVRLAPKFPIKGRVMSRNPLPPPPPLLPPEKCISVVHIFCLTGS